jgi:hypothetical protein
MFGHAQEEAGATAAFTSPESVSVSGLFSALLRSGVGGRFVGFVFVLAAWSVWLPGPAYVMAHQRAAAAANVRVRVLNGKSPTSLENALAIGSF